VFRYFFLLSLLSSSLFAQPVTVIPHTRIRANYGESFLEYRQVKPHVNSFKVYYLPSQTCPIAPTVIIQARYRGNINWQNMEVDSNGVFRHSGFTLDALKLIFRQYSYPSVDCVMYVLGVEEAITTLKD